MVAGAGQPASSSRKVPVVGQPQQLRQWCGEAGRLRTDGSATRSASPYVGPSAAVSSEAAPAGGMTKLLGFLDDAHMKDPVELTSTLRSEPALLQPDESIDAAFKCGRDLFLISTKRIIVIDKKGMQLISCSCFELHFPVR